MICISWGLHLWQALSVLNTIKIPLGKKNHKIPFNWGIFIVRPWISPTQRTDYFVLTQEQWWGKMSNVNMYQNRKCNGTTEHWQMTDDQIVWQEQQGFGYLSEQQVFGLKYKVRVNTVRIWTMKPCHLRKARKPLIYLIPTIRFQPYSYFRISIFMLDVSYFRTSRPLKVWLSYFRTSREIFLVRLALIWA